MKLIQSTLLIPAFLFGCAANLAAQSTILVDFGKRVLESSAATDPNGYHWNNISPEPSATNGVLGWELLTTEQKAAYKNPGVHYQLPGILPYVAVADAVDTTGAATGVAITLTDLIDIADYTNAGGLGVAGLEYGDDLGPIPTSTGYPGTATIDSFYVNWEFEAIFTISGLNNSETYTIKLWSAQGVESRATSFIVNGNLEGEQTIETLNNSGANPSDYALFENVSPVNGSITVQFEQGVELLGLPNGHLSVMEISGNIDGVGEATWLGYPVDESGWADTGSFLGNVYVTHQPWIWIANLERYAYIPNDSGWVYVPR
jgi:hypothetical protein